MLPLVLPSNPPLTATCLQASSARPAIRPLATYASLSDDPHLAADNASVVNAVAMTRVVKDQAMAIGEGRKAELDNGITIWATGTGNFGDCSPSDL